MVATVNRIREWKRVFVLVTRNYGKMYNGTDLDVLSVVQEWTRFRQHWLSGQLGRLL